MRTLALAAFVAAALSLPLRADDTKGPAIQDVKASVKGGTVTITARITDETGVLSATVHHRTPGGSVDDTPMQKEEFGDTFRASFPGSADTEYWIDSSDLLGNASNYGSQSKAFAASGKAGKGGKAVAQNEPPPKAKEPEPAPVESKPAPEHRAHHGGRTHTASNTPPVIEHRKPSAQPPEGRDFTVRVRIHSESPVEVAVLQARAQGGAALSPIHLTHDDGDAWSAVIPGASAKGTLEYFILAKNAAGQQAKQGDGSASTPYTITFKAAAASQPAAQAATGPYSFAHLPLYRVAPQKPIVVRAQVTPATDDGDMPDRVFVLFRGNDAMDQSIDMVRDDTGGWGGYKAELPQQDEGAIFYEVVACDSSAAKCAVDTGSKRKWHAAAVAAQPGGAMPLPLDAVSSKAPASLPE